MLDSVVGLPWSQRVNQYNESSSIALWFPFLERILTNMSTEDTEVAAATSAFLVFGSRLRGQISSAGW